MNWYYIAALAVILFPGLVIAAYQHGFTPVLVGLGALVLIGACVCGATVLLCLAEERAERKK